MLEIREFGECSFLNFASPEQGIKKELLTQLGLTSIYLSDDVLFGDDDNEIGPLLSIIASQPSDKLIDISWIELIDPASNEPFIDEYVFAFSNKKDDLNLYLNQYCTRISGSSFELTFDPSFSFIMFHDPFCEYLEFAGGENLITRVSEACKEAVFTFPQVPTSDLQTLFVLNESSSMEQAGDLTFFDTLESVLSYVEPIDVANQEYYLFDSNGYFYQFNLNDEHVTVDAESKIARANLARSVIGMHMSETSSKHHLKTKITADGDLQQLCELCFQRQNRSLNKRSRRRRLGTGSIINDFLQMFKGK
ncbi:hypothetical protein [Pseudovibrio sp. WM33]|uniref:hypothetical protein n=1 Tax=Pseudovibrio sp. WM33 TaxID=1735585 RepID=UPI0007AEDFF5|nr:hypothetical protein [Pseudovibrio sp. WM33]KZL22525.1 hypothetical protein PsWM33_03875 [Pseudovibrio sp. WM33]